jgi:hypothetical protein
VSALGIWAAFGLPLFGGAAVTDFFPPIGTAQAFPGDSRRTLENADSLVVYALDPMSSRHLKGPPGFVPDDKPSESFHEFSVLGKATLDTAEKRRLLDSFYDELKPREGNRIRMSASCFLPRHGVRATDSRTGKQVDLVICFGCQNAFLYNNGEQFNFYAFGSASASCFHDIFAAHGLRAAP